MLISETQHNILSALARFKFLVISQILQLPLLNKSAGYIRQQLAQLVSGGYIKSHKLSKTYKTEAMYYLTENGKELIIQNSKLFDSDIKLVVGTPLFVNDFTHRRNHVSVTIQLYNKMVAHGLTVQESISYFDKQGENRKSGTLEAKTKIEIGKGFFIPDGIIITQTNAQQTIWLVETYCDAASTRILDQILNKHLIAIAQGTPGIKFGIKANPFVMSCFENNRVKENVIEKLQHNNDFIKHFKHLFYFSTLADLIKDNNAWHTVDGEMLVLS